MTESSIYDNFLTPETFVNPRPTLKAARAERPVFLTHNPKGRPVYVVTTFDLVRKIFMDRENFNSDFMPLFAEGSGSVKADEVLKGAPFEFSKVMNILLTADGPRHNRCRALVNPLFSMGAVKELAGPLQTITDELIDSFIERGECDLIEDFAVPLGLQMILGAAKIDQSILPRALAWSNAVMLRMGHLGSEEEEVAAAHLIVEMQQFIYNQIQDRRAKRQDDLISHLIDARVEGEAPLSDQEILAFMNEIVVAGNESTRHTMVAGTVLLLSHPDQMEAVLEDPSLWPNVVEEVLRFHSTGSATYRVTVKDVRIGDVDVPAGSVVMLRMDSANRDQQQFADPDTFDVRRSNARGAVPFGFGAHFCLGQFLARKEILVAMQSLFTRLKGLQLDEEKTDLSREPHMLIHALHKVHVRFEPGTKLAS